MGAELNIPWVFIGITDGMECGFNFKGHLQNGDPLTARTVQVPKGRPATGNPPFTWSQSARDALIYKGYHQVTDWSVPHMLHLFERYKAWAVSYTHLDVYKRQPISLSTSTPTANCTITSSRDDPTRIIWRLIASR